MFKLLVLSANLRKTTFSAMFRIRSGFNADPDRAFTSKRIRIRAAKPLRIHNEPDLDPDPGQTLLSQRNTVLFVVNVIKHTVQTYGT
jgi:hypothetical protein